MALPELKEIQEGSVKLLAPKAVKLTKKLAPFYNPEKESERTISVIFLKAYASMTNEPLSVCDLLTSSGVRGLRFACEVDGLKEVLLNDYNPVAYEIVKRNIEANRDKLKCEVKALNSEANKLLYSLRKRFDYIDVDPFGSPNPFLDAAIRFIRQNGILAVTSTDVGCLCGAYPETCLRKYGAFSFRTEYYAEIGARILAKKVIEVGAMYDIALEPVFIHYSPSYIRAYFKLNKGSKKVARVLEKLGFILHCNFCLNREALSYKEAFKDTTCAKCGYKMLVIGPLYLGNLWDEDLCKQMLNKALKNLSPLFKVILDECKMNVVTYFTTDSISKLLKTSELRLRRVINELRARGYKACRTHFSPKGFRTDASSDEVKRIFSRT